MAGPVQGERPERGLDFAPPSRRASTAGPFAERMRAPKGRVEGRSAESKGFRLTPGRCHRRPMHHVYILRCADGALYVGETTDVPARVRRHLEGNGSRFTARRRPVALVLVETYDSRAGALDRERQLKRWTRAKKEALIVGDMALLKRI